MRRHFPVHTIIEADVGGHTIRRGRTVPPLDVHDVLGLILPGDVGKRVYRINGVLQVENTQQRDERLANLERLKKI